MKRRPLISGLDEGQLQMPAPGATTRAAPTPRQCGDLQPATELADAAPPRIVIRISMLLVLRHQVAVLRRTDPGPVTTCVSGAAGPPMGGTSLSCGAEPCEPKKLDEDQIEAERLVQDHHREGTPIAAGHQHRPTSETAQAPLPRHPEMNLPEPIRRPHDDVRHADDWRRPDRLPHTALATTSPPYPAMAVTLHPQTLC
jgi:hypothetical protein